MPKSIEGRVALITGASRGIGQAIACRFAAERADVALVGRGPDRRSTHLARVPRRNRALAQGMNGGRVHVVRRTSVIPAPTSPTSWPTSSPRSGVRRHPRARRRGATRIRRRPAAGEIRRYAA